MDDDEPFLTKEMHAALRPQRPPERFAERVMSVVATRRGRTRRGVRTVVVGAATVVAAAAAFALLGSKSLAHGEILATTRQDVRLGPRVVAALSPGAHITWAGDDVTQLDGEVFYRVEPGSAERVHTSAGDVTVHGTCFDVSVRGGEPEGAATMKRRDAMSGAAGAIAAAAVLVGVYEGRVTLARVGATVDLTSGQAARADERGVHGPEDLAAARRAFEASPGADPWRAANASLTDQLALYQRRLEENETDKKKIERELRQLREKVAEGLPDGGRPRDVMKVDARDLTHDDLKDLAKKGVVRAQFFCPPPDWHTSPDQLAKLGLAPGDAPALEHAVAATQAHMWQTVAPECTKLVGSLALATRLGSEMCGLIVQSSAPKATADKSIQLVADILAGNTQAPTGPVDPLAARILAETQQNAIFEADLAQALGPETAHSIARNEDLGLGCGMDFGPDR